MVNPGLQAQIDQLGAELREKFSAEGIDLEDTKTKLAVLGTFAFLAQVHTANPAHLPFGFLVLHEATKP